MKGFLYFGRLDSEKGFEMILEMIKHFQQKNEFGKYELPFNLFIFGEGKHKNNLLKIMETTQNIHYFGFQPKEKIKAIAQNCHFTLMPSIFLETFGLSALESLNMGLPVIGFKKGGINKFILPELDISTEKGDSDTKKLINKIEKLLELNEEKIEKLREEGYKIASQYEETDRENNIKKILPKNTKKILLVSDFSSKFGGIETYLEKIQKILKYLNIETKLFACNCKKKSNIKFGTLISIANFTYKLKLNKTINQFQPDLIRYHSTLRFLGRMSFLAGKNVTKWRMIHDFGYFTALPSKISQENQIPKKLNFKEFLLSTKELSISKKFLLIPLLTLKYLHLKLIKKAVRLAVSKILVPSEFMKKYAVELFEFDEENVIVLPHFD